MQIIIYDVYLARTGNCDIAASQECETVRLKQYNTECARNSFIAWCNCKENRVIANVYLQELCYILLVMNLWGITVKCTVYVCSLYLYGGPTSVTETVRLIYLLLYNCFTILKEHRTKEKWPHETYSVM